MLRMYKKVLIPIGLALGVCIGIYFVYFHRPPTDDILAANRKQRNSVDKPWSSRRSGGQKAAPGGGGGDDYYYDDESSDYDEDDAGLEGMDEVEAAKVSHMKWQRFLDRNDYVSIGGLFDRCEGDNKVTLGQVILLTDKDTGGIMSRTFINTTMVKEVTGGEMYLECSYNGKELYSNHWDLCTVEKNMPDRVIFCPIAVGKHKFIKDLKIPTYLPRGRYTTKAWLTNQDEEILGCAFADFTI